MLSYNRIIAIETQKNLNLLPRTESDREKFISALIITCCLSIIAHPADAVTPVKVEAEKLPLRVIVNSDRDGDIQPDEALTLREAIEIVNGTLPLERLSTTEKQNVETLTCDVDPNDCDRSQIKFNLPAEQTTIQLTSILPPLATPKLVVDGTSQPGYRRDPIVAITTAENAEVWRGLTVVADGVTIKGLSLYGFTAKDRDPRSSPTADIFISDRLLASNSIEQRSPDDNLPPQAVVIANNWLGIKPDGGVPQNRSDFGIYVFNSLNPTIKNNLISNHNGSGIITSVAAENFKIAENVITRNGLTGMPDAIRLEGKVAGGEIQDNIITDNDGSGIFLFKTDGAVKIANNQIKFNGLRLRRAAIYLMGNDHQVINNQITDQPAAGVVVTSYPQSDRNFIQNNQFSNIAGLSIDLNTQHNVEAIDYQQGDGPNPKRNSPNRRRDTGNGAINAPEFLAREFLIINGKVNLDGIADPGSQIEIYRTSGNNSDYNSLSESLTIVEADERGKFSATFTNLQPGDRISAIATHPQYGTSEPALNAAIR
jgi:parallel beta-helix repeat protein